MFVSAKHRYPFIDILTYTTLTRATPNPMEVAGATT